MRAVPKSNQEWGRLAATDPLGTIVSLAGVRRLVAKVELTIEPDLDVSRRPWVISQYHTCPAEKVLGWFAAAGFARVERFEFRPGQPHSAVYLGIKE